MAKNDGENIPDPFLLREMRYIQERGIDLSGLGEYIKSTGESLPQILEKFQVAVAQEIGTVRLINRELAQEISSLQQEISSLQQQLDSLNDTVNEIIREQK